MAKNVFDYTIPKPTDGGNKTVRYTVDGRYVSTDSKVIGRNVLAVSLSDAEILILRYKLVEGLYDVFAPGFKVGEIRVTGKKISTVEVRFPEPSQEQFLIKTAKEIVSYLEGVSPQNIDVRIKKPDKLKK